MQYHLNKMKTLQVGLQVGWGPILKHAVFIKNSIIADNYYKYPI